MPEREPQPWEGGTDTAFASPEVFHTCQLALEFAILESHHHGCDVAEILSLAITQSAKEVGGVDELLKYRLGSWEAAAVRGLLGDVEQ